MTDMDLIHYSSAPLGRIRSARQERDGNAAPHSKPNGLWVSVKGEWDWPSWCQAESFALDRMGHATRVLLAPTAKMLHLNGADEIDEFTARYSVPWGPPRPGSKFDWRRIDWRAVASKYHGLIIAPYCWERRLAHHTSWYYGWDCASGCIWNARAIRATEAAPAECPMREVVAA